MKSLYSLFFAMIMAITVAISPAFADGESVNINTADAHTLSINLTGIGEKKAEAIVAYRQQYGAFKAVEELTEVKGIGASTIEKNRDRIRLE